MLCSLLIALLELLIFLFELNKPIAKDIYERDSSSPARESELAIRARYGDWCCAVHCSSVRLESKITLSMLVSSLAGS